MTKLLPCPLCGASDPEYLHCPGEGEHIIRCRNPNCNVTVQRHYSKKLCVRTWNNRPSAPSDAVDEAFALLTEIKDWLRDPKLGTWPYIEGTDFHADRQHYADRVDALKSTTQTQAAAYTHGEGTDNHLLPELLKAVARIKELEALLDRAAKIDGLAEAITMLEGKYKGFFDAGNAPTLVLQAARAYLKLTEGR